MNRVGIGVLHYNEPLGWFKDAIQSALNQTYSVDVIMVQHGWEYEYPEKYTPHFKGVDYYAIAENTGHWGNAVNQWTRLKDWEYVVPLCCDDTLHPDFVSHLIELADREQADVAAPNVAYYSKEELQRRNPLPYTSLIRRQALLDVGGYHTDAIADDWDLWMRMEIAGKKIVTTNEVLFNYTRREGQMSSPLNDVTTYNEMYAYLKEKNKALWYE